MTQNIKVTIYALIVFAVLLANGVKDLKERNTTTWLFAAAFGIGAAISGHPVLCVIGFIICLFCPDMKHIGGGDIDALFLVFTSAFTDILLPVLFATVAAVIYFLKTKKKDIPYVFCLAAGFGVYLVLRLISQLK